MKTGIKVGPSDWKEVLEKSKAKYCEVWFRLDWEEKYTSLFDYLNKNKINFGLHFWAMVDNKYFPNLLGLHQDIAEKTFNMIKQTIDIAKKWQAVYVNFHPESYRLNLLDLNNEKIKTLNPDESINKKKGKKEINYSGTTSVSVASIIGSETGVNLTPPLETGISALTTLK